MLLKMLRLLFLMNFCLDNYYGGPYDGLKTGDEKLSLDNTLVESNVNGSTSSIFGNADSNLVIEKLCVTIPFNSYVQGAISEENLFRRILLPENPTSVSISNEDHTYNTMFVEDPNPHEVISIVVI